MRGFSFPTSSNLDRAILSQIGKTSNSTIIKADLSSQNLHDLNPVKKVRFIDGRKEEFTEWVSKSQMSEIREEISKSMEPEKITYEFPDGEIIEQQV